MQPLSKEQVSTFHFLVQSVHNRRLIAMPAIRKEDGKQIAILAYVIESANNTTQIQPLAVLIDNRADFNKYLPPLTGDDMTKLIEVCPDKFYKTPKNIDYTLIQRGYLPSGNPINEKTRAILYLCEFDRYALTIVVLREMLFENIMDCMNAYSNIPNPESQMVSGKTFQELCNNLIILHKNMANKKWLEQLKESI